MRITTETVKVENLVTGDRIMTCDGPEISTVEIWTVTGIRSNEEWPEQVLISFDHDPADFTEGHNWAKWWDVERLVMIA